LVEKILVNWKMAQADIMCSEQEICSSTDGILPQEAESIQYFSLVKPACR